MRDDVLERVMTDWLADGPDDSPAPPVEAAIAHARAHRQRGAAGWRSVVARLAGDARLTLPGAVPDRAWVALVAILAVALAGMLIAGGQERRGPAPTAAPPVPAVVPPAPSATPQPARSPAPLPPDAGPLAYVVDGDIRVLEPGAASSRRVTATQGSREIVGAWSPDGSQLAYWVMSRSDGTLTRTDFDLWVMDRDGTDGRVLSESNDGSTPLEPHLAVSWAPDGSAIALTRYLGWAIPSVSLAGLDGSEREIPGGVRHIGQTGYANPVFSPDGRLIAIAAANGGGSEWQGISVVVADPAGGAEPRLLESTLAAGDIGTDSIGWEDSTSLVFVAEGALWRVNADGTALLRLTPKDLTVHRAATSPGSPVTALIATREGAPDAALYVMSDGGTYRAGHAFPVWLLRAAAVCRSSTRHVDPLAWSPDGRYLAFLARPGDGGGCTIAWIRAQPTDPPAWGSPEFSNPDIWEEPEEVPVSLGESAGDTIGIAWGSAAP